MTKKQTGINAELEKAMAKMLREVMANTEATLTDKCKVLDRAIKVEALKQKIQDDGYGKGFFTDDDEG